MSDSPSMPAQPNYGQVAQQQGQANIDTAKVQGVINNPNINTPYGSQTVTWGAPGGGTNGGAPTDPAATAWRQAQIAANPGGFMDTGPGGAQVWNSTGSDPGGGGGMGGGGGGGMPGNQATVTQTLSPEQQKLYEGQNQISQQVLGIGQRGLFGLSDTLGTPLDSGSAKAATDKAYANITSRLDPQFARSQSSLETQLTNQGLRPGSEAWGNAMKDFNYGKNDAYTQANTQAMGFAPQTQQMDIAGRNQPLNELNALRTGAQVQNPQFSPFQGAGNIAPAPVMQGALAGAQGSQNMYNAQMGASNANTAGLYSLAGTAAGIALF